MRQGTIESMDAQAAEIITNLINASIEDKGICVFGIVGGRSVSGIFRLLRVANIDWEKVDVFMVDEKKVPLDHPESNFKLACDTFLNYVNANKRPYDVNKDLSEYNSELRRTGDFDVILLSAGEDGHIGALYPNHHSIESNAEFYIEMNDGLKTPPQRVTASRRLLEKSANAVLLFYGSSKQDALNNFLDDSVSVEDCPAKLVKNIENYYVLVGN